MTKYVVYALVSLEFDVDDVEQLEAMKASFQDAPLGMLLREGDMGVLQTYND